MPKNAINYLIQEITFYRFVCQDATIINTYVGSTVSFVKRKQTHKSSCNNPNGKAYNFKVYLTIRENGGWCDWKMVEIERRICKDKRDAERIEQEWIEKYESNMNTIKAFVTVEQRQENMIQYNNEYYLANKEKIAEQGKQYRIVNKEKLQEKAKQYYIKNKENLK